MRQLYIGLTFIFYILSVGMSLVSADNPKAVQTKSGLYLIVTGEDGTPSFVKLDVIAVNGTVPVTPTNPDTPAEVPEGTYGLTKLAYDAGMGLSPGSREKAVEVSKAFFPKIGIKTHQELVSDTLSRMSAVLGDDKGDWPIWWELVSEKLEALEHDGKFRKFEESKAAWSAIADGLEAVR